MSQEKVNYKKELKKDRKKIVKKQRIERIVLTLAASVVCIAIAGWIGFSVYTKAEAAKDAEVTYTAADLSSITEYLSSLSETEDAE